MTTKDKAQALVKRLRIIPDQNGMMYEDYEDVMQAADLIEQHEAFRQEVSDALRDQLLQECLIKLRDVQGTEAPKQYACNLIKRIERALQEQSK